LSLLDNNNTINCQKIQQRIYMKKILITLSLLVPFCACYSYPMDDYFQKWENKINQDNDRAATYEAQRQQAETNRAVQQYIAPSPGKKTTKAYPG
jgi:hypothetical protein